MFDLSWGEILVIGAVAVVFIGPKELPGALRTVGKWMGKARLMAGDFQRHVDDMVREADLQDVKKQFDDIRGLNPTSAIEKVIDPKGELRGALDPFAAPGKPDPALGKPEAPSIAAPAGQAPVLENPVTTAPAAAPVAPPTPAAPAATAAATADKPRGG